MVVFLTVLALSIGQLTVWDYWQSIFLKLHHSPLREVNFTNEICSLWVWLFLLDINNLCLFYYPKRAEKLLLWVWILEHSESSQSQFTLYGYLVKAVPIHSTKNKVFLIYSRLTPKMSLELPAYLLLLDSDLVLPIIAGSVQCQVDSLWRPSDLEGDTGHYSHWRHWITPSALHSYHWWHQNGRAEVDW
jgi:hypothetical protein